MEKRVGKQQVLSLSEKKLLGEADSVADAAHNENSLPRCCPNCKREKIVRPIKKCVWAMDSMMWNAWFIITMLAIQGRKSSTSTVMSSSVTFSDPVVRYGPQWVKSVAVL